MGGELAAAGQWRQEAMAADGGVKHFLKQLVFSRMRLMFNRLIRGNHAGGLSEHPAGQKQE
jgi:hypothetical protein